MFGRLGISLNDAFYLKRCKSNDHTLQRYHSFVLVNTNLMTVDVFGVCSGDFGAWCILQSILHIMLVPWMCIKQSLLVITMLVPPSCRGWMDSKDETAIKRVVMAALLPTLIVKLEHKQNHFLRIRVLGLCLAAVKRQSPIIHHPPHHKRQSLFQCHVGLHIINVRNHILQVKKDNL